MMLSKTITEINVGDSAEFTRILTEDDILSSPAYQGGCQPIRMDKNGWREKSRRPRMVPGITLARLVGEALGAKLLDPECNNVHQTFYALKPVYMGDKITATVEVITKDEARHQVWLKTYCTNQRGHIVGSGQAMMMPPGKKIA